MSEFFAPGKLFVAGEYAVVSPGETAVVMPVNRGITARATRVSPADVGGVVVLSPHFDGGSFTWQAPARRSGSSPGGPVGRALDVLHEYRNGAGTDAGAGASGTLAPMEIELVSTLEDPDGTKYGFGSSGAVVVATIASASEALGEVLSRATLFRLAALAVLRTSPNASCADVAVAVEQSWVRFDSFDWSALLSGAGDSVSGEASREWPGPGVTRLPAPEGLWIVVGHSGVPASTDVLVSRMREALRTGTYDIQEFNRLASAAAREIADACGTGDSASPARIVSAIREARSALETLDRRADPHGEPLGLTPPPVRAMIDLAESFGAASKFSGAGGGDCVIAATERPEVAEKVASAWAAAGYTVVERAGIRPVERDKETA